MKRRSIIVKKREREREREKERETGRRDTRKIKKSNQSYSIFATKEMNSVESSQQTEPTQATFE